MDDAVADGRRRPTARTSVVLGALAGLLACAPAPSTAVQTLREPLSAAAVDVTAPVVALLALLAWALTGWLLVAIALTACSRLPGVGGRAGAAVLRRVAPAAVRRVLALALGLSVATGLAGAPASAASTGAGAGPALPAAAPTSPLLDWPATQPGPPDRGEPVVVRPGDSLWALAERALPAGAPAAQVAAAWPAWWSANRAVIGDDPDLLRPGAVLTPPASPQT